jgi:hypothetical protein
VLSCVCVCDCVCVCVFGFVVFFVVLPCGGYDGVPPPLGPTVCLCLSVCVCLVGDQFPIHLALGVYGHGVCLHSHFIPDMQRSITPRPAPAQCRHGGHPSKLSGPS